MHSKKAIFVSSILSLLFWVTNAHSDEITLYAPIMEDSPQQHLFFHDLIKTALEEFGHKTVLVSKKLPQLRIKKYMDKGELSFFWSLENAQLNEKYIAIKVGLTDGLIGKRVLLIKKGEQPIYDQVKNLQDFKQLDLVAGMGKGWFDVEIWKKNGLKYKESSGNWRSIFKMIPHGRDYNYISRGVNEIQVEAKEYTNLEIEKNLLFNYDHDCYFYLSKVGHHSGVQYKKIIEQAMINAQKSGLIQRLIEKHWPDALSTVNADERIEIHLDIPSL